MSSQGRRLTTAGLTMALLAASIGVSSGGYVLLLCLVGLVAGINLLAVGIWMADNPSATVSAALAAGISVLATFLRRNLAIIGLITASSAVVAVVGEASPPALCIGFFALLVFGVSMITAGVLALPVETTGVDVVQAEA